jgi:hypothetical protein
VVGLEKFIICPPAKRLEVIEGQIEGVLREFGTSFGVFKEIFPE